MTSTKDLSEQEREQELEAFVRVARAAEAGELAHGPQPAPIPTRMDAARVRILARHRQRGGVEVLHVQGRVDWLNLTL